MANLRSFLKKLYPFKGYKVFVESIDNKVIIGLKNRKKTGKCPKCGKHCTNIEMEYKKQIRDLDLADKICYIHFKQKKLHCKCGFRGMEELDFLAKFDRVTKRLANRVAECCENSTIKDVANQFKLNWKTVKEIDKEHIKILLPKIQDLVIRRIAIDEIAIMKGHKYFSILRDYDTGVTINIFFGRTYEETLKALNTLGSEKFLVS